MTVCFIPRCHHNAERDTCQFFRFPNDEKEKKRWIKLVRRADREPNKNSRICSCHFPNGNKELGPSIFPWNKAKLFNISFPNDMKNTRRSSQTTRVLGQPPVKMDDEIEFVHITPDVQIVEEVEYVYDNTPIEMVEQTKVVRDMSTQTINSLLLECEITLLKSEIESLKAENSRLLKQPFGFASIQHNESAVKYYTGINRKAFNLLCEMVSRAELKYFYGWKSINMNVADQILMTLMKLKLNLDYTDIQVRFNVSKHTIGNIIITFIHVLREVLFESGVENVPHSEGNVSNPTNSPANSVNSTMMVDCAEFSCEAPNSRDDEKETSSTCKLPSSTLKGTVGISPNGCITYASKFCVDSSAEENVARLCCVADIFKAGDFISTANRFRRLDSALNNASLNVPPSSSNPKSASKGITETKKRIRSRMHLERVVRRLRLFRIFHSIPKNFIQYSSTVFQLCVALTNWESLIGELSDCSNSTDDSVVEKDAPSEHNKDV